MAILWAVHISDGVLAGSWLAGGFALAGLLALWGGRRLQDEEIPRVAILSSAFFVASLIHVRVPGGSVHLLFNGLVGVILGPRATLAIPLGLFLQAILFSHGGLSTLGVNSCIMVPPALGVWLLFAVVRNRTVMQQRSVLWATGFLLGVFAVLATAALCFLALLLGGGEDLKTLAWFAFVLHLPVAAVEAFIMAATLTFLAHVKPEMIGMRTSGRASP